MNTPYHPQSSIFSEIHCLSNSCLKRQEKHLPLHIRPWYVPRYNPPLSTTPLLSNQTGIVRIWYIQIVHTVLHSGLFMDRIYFCKHLFVYTYNGIHTYIYIIRKHIIFLIANNDEEMKYVALYFHKYVLIFVPLTTKR